MSDGLKNGLRIAFVAGLSNAKLLQKLAPLASLQEVESIDVFRRRPPTSLPEKARWRAIPGVFRWSGIASEAWRAVILAGGCGGYDLVVGCFQRWHGVWTWLSGGFAGKPVVQLVVTSVDWNLERSLCAKAMLAATACGVRGPSAERALRAAGFKGAIEVIHNPYDAPPFPSAPPGEMKYDIIAVADFAREKDYPWMLEVLAALRARRPEFKALLCGRGLEVGLAGLARRLGVGGHVEFAGHLTVDSLHEAYSRSRCFLSTSRAEGLPQSAVEALSFGLPCAMSDVGDCRWLVEGDGLAGRVVRHGDTEAMASAVDELVGASYAAPVAARQAARGRFDVLARDFSLDEIAKRWRVLISGALEKQGG